MLESLHSQYEWNKCGATASHERQRESVTIMAQSRDPLSLIQGTVDLLILRAVQRDPAHGYAISRWVRERSEGVLTIDDAALYQALHRLEARAWIESAWGLSDNNRRAKYYALTSEGRKQLRSEVSTWKRYAEAVFKVIEPA